MAKEQSIIKKFSRFLFICLFTAVTLAFSLGILAALGAPQSPQANVRYVRVDGVDGNSDCTAVNNPCATVQYAVDIAAPGDEIWVASGTYTGIQVRQAITQHLYISQSVNIRGGFTAVFDTPPDSQNNPTILNAAGLGRVVYVSEGVTVWLTGLQLANGNAGSHNGGGLYAANGRVIISDTTFLHNRAEFGGGLYLLQGQLTMQNSQFTGNEARLGGGAARLYGNTAVLSNNRFIRNTAGLHGGGLYVTAGQLTLRGNQIANNSVTAVDQGWGGGLHLNNGQATLTANSFTNNQAYTGGGLRLFQSQATLDANAIRANQATIAGGLSVEANSEASLINNVFVDNTAVTGSPGLAVLNARLALTHTTIARNQGGDGSGVAVTSGQVTLVNSIIASQTVGILNGSGTVTMTATLWDAVSQPFVGSVSQSGGITGTAVFAADGYHLTAVSDAIDNGVDAGVMTDIDGLPRPIGAGFDLGAVEWRDLTAVKTVQPAIAVPGDVVTYTIVLTAPATPGMMVQLTDTLPLDVTFIGPLTYSAGSGGFSGGVITWTGQILTDTAVILSWPVQLNTNLPIGTGVANTAVIHTPIGIAPSTTAVVTIPAKIYLPIIVRD